MSHNPNKPILPPKAGYIERNGRYYNIETGEMLRDVSEFTLPELKASKLKESSKNCHELIVNHFSCNVKNGMQTYRMNEDDQTNTTGYLLLTAFMIIQEQDLNTPRFLHKNITQLECELWTANEIISYMQYWEAYKAKILHKQDLIKIEILNCETVEELEGVDISYENI